MADLTFDGWIEATLELEKEAFGNNPITLQGDVLGDFFLQMGHAAIAEIQEALDECGYKAWTQPRGWVNREAFIGELVDALHFIALMLAAVGCSGEQLTAQYFTKMQRNADRQAAKDDGENRKCQGCRRSLDDTGVSGQLDHSGEVFRCNACGWPISRRQLELMGSIGRKR